MTLDSSVMPKRRAGRVAILLVALSVAGSLAGCRSIPADVRVPDGFAAYTDTDLFTVVSPESVTLRVKRAANDPAQSLEFWAEALSVSLSRGGYQLLDQGSFESPAGEGRYFEWAAPVGEEDWVYLTAVAVTDDHLLIVEGAGPFEHFLGHRAAILESLETLSPR